MSSPKWLLDQRHLHLGIPGLPTKDFMKMGLHIWIILAQQATFLSYWSWDRKKTHRKQMMKRVQAWQRGVSFCHQFLNLEVVA